MKAIAFLNRQRKVSGPDQGHGFAYLETPYFGRSNTARLALARPYTLPLANVSGSDGFPVRRSIGGPQPAVATSGYTNTFNDPRGHSGNSPIPSVPTINPLVNNQQVYNANLAVGNAGAYSTATPPSSSGFFSAILTPFIEALTNLAVQQQKTS